MPSEEPDRISVLQGTLDLIVLRTLQTMGPQHAYAIATRLQQVSEDLLHLNQGTLYPALVRLEQQGSIKGSWGKTESNRDAKYYAITKAGRESADEGSSALASNGGPGGQTAFRGSVIHAPILRETVKPPSRPKGRTRTGPRDREPPGAFAGGF